jgi:peroxiredoxin Q/BCP
MVIVMDLLNRLAPDFTLESDSSEEITLSELRAKPVVLYFYPVADAKKAAL